MFCMELSFLGGGRRVSVAVVTDTNFGTLVFLSCKLLIWTICSERFGVRQPLRVVEGAALSRGRSLANKHRIRGIRR